MTHVWIQPQIPQYVVYTLPSNPIGLVFEYDETYQPSTEEIIQVLHKHNPDATLLFYETTDGTIHGL